MPYANAILKTTSNFLLVVDYWSTETRVRLIELDWDNPHIKWY